MLESIFDFHCGCWSQYKNDSGAEDEDQHHVDIKISTSLYSFYGLSSISKAILH